MADFLKEIGLLAIILVFPLKIPLPENLQSIAREFELDLDPC